MNQNRSWKTEIVILLIALIILLFSSLVKCSERDKNKIKSNLTVATYATNSLQVKQVKILVNSIRKFGGSYADSPIYILLNDTINISVLDFIDSNVHLLSVELDSLILNYPLAIKAFAASNIEKLVWDKTSTLAWFDPETIVLGPLDELYLNDKYSAAVKPVFLQNKIGLLPDEEPNLFWSSIYKATGLKVKEIPVVETIGDEKKIRAYFNCEIFSVDPGLGILREWSRILLYLLKDSTYQSNACSGFLQQLFLHQAVLSAVIVSKVQQDKMHWLPLSCGYPFNLHTRLPANKKAKLLDSLSCVILENVWIKNPNWMDEININEPLKSWILKEYSEFIKNK